MLWSQMLFQIIYENSCALLVESNQQLKQRSMYTNELFPSENLFASDQFCYCWKISLKFKVFSSGIKIKYTIANIQKYIQYLSHDNNFLNQLMSIISKQKDRLHFKEFLLQK